MWTVSFVLALLAVLGIFAAYYFGRFRLRSTLGNLETLNNLQRQFIASSRNPSEVGLLLIQHVEKLLPIDGYEICLQDEGEWVAILRKYPSKLIETEVPCASPIVVSYLVTSSRSLHIADIHTVAPELAEYMHLTDKTTASLLAMPITTTGELKGLVSIYALGSPRYTEQHIRIFETFADAAAIALGQAANNAAQDSALARLSALSVLNRRFFSTVALDELLELTVNDISRSFGYDCVLIFLSGESRMWLSTGVGGYTVRLLANDYYLDLEPESFMLQSLDSGELRVRDLAGVEAEQYSLGFASEAVIPLTVGELAIGTVVALSHKTNVFDLQEQITLQAIGENLSLAFRNAILYVAESSRRQLADTLRDINATVIRERELKQVLRSVVNGFCRVLSVDAASIFLLSADEQHFELAVTTEEALRRLYDSEYPLRHFTYSGRSDLEDAITYIYKEVLNLDVASRILIPLVDNTRQIGFLVANRPVSDVGLATDDTIAQAFAAQAAVAIRNAQLYEAQQAEAWVTTGLLQLAEAVNAQLHSLDALQMVAYMTAMLSNTRMCVLLRSGETDDRFDIVAAHGPDETTDALVGLSLFAENHSYFQLVSLAERPLGAGVDHDLPLPEVFRQVLEIQNIIGFPLWSLSEPIGLLIVDDPFEGNTPAQRWLRLVTGIAHQAATLLETANLQESDATRRRLEHELSIAHAIQVGFIPDDFDPIPGWDVAATWRAAQQVGGDFYDFIKLADGRWGLVIADVTGKGVPAALFMAMCRSIIRAAAINRTSAKETLERFNDLLLNDSRSDMFLTAFYAIWDPETGHLEYSSAGHNPALFYQSESEEVIELTSPGIAAGIIRDVDLLKNSLHLEIGDVLVLYTDGITEAMRLDNTEWGREALKKALQDENRGSADNILSAILARVERFTSGAPQADDMTLLVLKRVRK